MSKSDEASPVKTAIDIQSGRFEFFKQTLTLGSAGIAGIAALFTDTSRIPTEMPSKYAVAVAGMALIFMVAFAAMGLSTYANLLTALGRESGLLPSTKRPHRPSTTFIIGIVHHANVIIVALFVTWFSLTFFAGFRLFVSAKPSIEAAITTARMLVSKETGQPSESLFLTRLEAKNGTYVVTYSIQAVPSETTVTISTSDGTVTGIVQERKTTAPAGAKQP